MNPGFLCVRGRSTGAQPRRGIARSRCLVAIGFNSQRRRPKDGCRKGVFRPCKVNGVAKKRERQRFSPMPRGRKKGIPMLAPVCGLPERREGSKSAKRREEMSNSSLHTFLTLAGNPLGLPGFSSCPFVTFAPSRCSLSPERRNFGRSWGASHSLTGTACAHTGGVFFAASNCESFSSASRCQYSKSSRMS